MRSKMLSSMTTVLDSSNDPNMVDKAVKASATVTANSNQMPLNNQVRFIEYLLLTNRIAFYFHIGKRCRNY